jgi:hypothetical protein
MPKIEIMKFLSKSLAPTVVNGQRAYLMWFMCLLRIIIQVLKLLY